MNSLFSPAPFARFDLGKHVLGQNVLTQEGCPIGTLPLRLPNGTVVCSKASPASGMFMPGVPGANVSYGSGMGGRLGQMQDPYLTQAARDQILTSVQTGLKYVVPIDNMMVWSVDNDPRLKNYLGDDWSRFFALSDSIAPLYPTVEELVNRLSNPDAEMWYTPAPEELAAVKQWTTGVTEMWQILQAHQVPAKPIKLTATSTPPPSVKPVPTQTMPPTKMVQSSGSKMPSTNEMLVGGAVAVGLGVLLYGLLG